MTENLLQQDFSPHSPNRSWAGDITYIRTRQAGAIWPSGSIDTAAGWSAGPWAPPWKPRWYLRLSTGPWVNAVVESFFSTLKHELDLDDDAEILQSPQHLMRHLAFWVDGYYNRERHQSTIGDLSPINYEQ